MVKKNIKLLSLLIVPAFLIGLSGIANAGIFSPDQKIQTEVLALVDTTGVVSANITANKRLVGFSVNGTGGEEIGLYDASAVGNLGSATILAEAAHRADETVTIMFPGTKKITNGVVIFGPADSNITLFYE